MDLSGSNEGYVRTYGSFRMEGENHQRFQGGWPTLIDVQFAAMLAGSHIRNYNLQATSWAAFPVSRFVGDYRHFFLLHS